MVDVNGKGVLNGVAAVLPTFIEQKAGHVIATSSVAGLKAHPGGALTGNPGIPAYIASKHGVVGLTRTAALEYVKRGIRVNAVNPGLIDTQVARDVVNGDEQAYAEIAKHVPIRRAGRPRKSRRSCCGSAARGRARWSAMPSPWTAD